MAVKPLRPLNRIRKFTGVAGQSGDPNRLAANCVFLN